MATTGTEDGCWVNLLSNGFYLEGKRSPLKREKFVPRHSLSSLRQTVAVRENSPSSKTQWAHNTDWIDPVSRLKSGPYAPVEKKCEHNVVNKRPTSEVEELQVRLSAAEEDLKGRSSWILKLSAENKRLSDQVELLWKNAHGSKSAGLSPVNSFSGLTPPTKDLSSPLDSGRDVEVQSLRDALDQVTKEKKGLEVLCQHLKETNDYHSEDGLMGSQIKDNDFFDLKRELAEEKAVCAQLRETIAKTQGNPQRTSHFVTLSKEIKLLKLKLEQVVKDKSAEVDVSLEECERLHNEKAQLMKEKDLLATSLRQETVYTHHLEDEHATLEGQLGELRATVKRVMDDLEVERSKSSSISEDYDSLLKEYHHLQCQLEEQTQSSTEIVGSLQEQLDLAQQKLTNQIEVVQITKRELDTLKSELREAQSELSWQQEANGALRSNQVQLEAEVASYSAECSKLREGLSALSNQSRTHLQQEVETLRDQLEHKEKEIGKLKSHDCQVTKGSHPGIEDELTTANLLLQQEISELKLSIALLEQSVMEKDKLLNEMRENLEDSTDDVDLGGEGKTLQSLQEECARLTSELHILKESQIVGITSPRSNRGESSKLEQSCNALKQVVALLTMEVKRTKDDNHSLRKEVEEKDQQIHQLLVTTDSQELPPRSHPDLLSHQSDSSVGEGQILFERWQSSEAALKESRNQVKLLQRTEAELTAKCQELSSELHQANVEILHLQEVLKGECTSIRTMSSEQERQITILSRESAQVCQHTSTAEDVCTDKEKSIREREDSIAELISEVEGLRQEHTTLSQQLVDCPLSSKSIIVQLKKEKEALRQLVGKLSEEKKQLERETGQLQAALLSAREQKFKEEFPRTERHVDCGVSALPVSTACKSVQANLSRKQLNYLRTKLGYALTELRLYKKQKDQMDACLSQVKEGMDLTKEEYRKCLQLLNGAILHNH